MTGPLVSVITPSYNQGQYLEETILSVINQNYKNIEYIIIDGGSSDNSIDLIRKYSSRLAYWVSEPDKGQADAINKGFNKANGDFICWLNSDDCFYPGFISSRLKQFQENPGADMIYGDVDQGRDIENVWLRKGAITSFDLMLKTIEVPVPQQSAIWKKSVLERTGLLDIKWHVLLDRDYFIRISRNNEIQYFPGALAFFRIHSQSKSVKESLQWVEELPVYYQLLIEKWPEYKKQRHHVMAKCYWLCSNICSESKEIIRGKVFLEMTRRESFPLFVRFSVTKILVKIKHQLIHKQAGI